MKVRMQSSFDASYWSHEMEIAALLFRTTAMLNRGPFSEGTDHFGRICGIEAICDGIHSNIDCKNVELGSKIHDGITFLELGVKADTTEVVCRCTI